MGEIEELKKEAGLKFKNNFDAKDCAGLSNEVKEILLKNSPKTLKAVEGTKPAKEWEFSFVRTKSQSKTK